MTLIRKGQKVKLTPRPNAKFSGEVVGIIRDDFNYPNLGETVVFHIVDALGEFNTNAWSLEVVNKFPTEPGVYISSAFVQYPTMASIFRLYGGKWHNAEGYPLVSLAGLRTINTEHGLTRLVPEA